MGDEQFYIARQQILHILNDMDRVFSFPFCSPSLLLSFSPSLLLSSLFPPPSSSPANNALVDQPPSPGEREGTRGPLLPLQGLRTRHQPPQVHQTRSTTQHHAAPRSIHAAPRSTTQHRAAPRSTTQHHAAPRSPSYACFSIFFNFFQFFFNFLILLQIHPGSRAGVALEVHASAWPLQGPRHPHHHPQAHHRSLEKPDRYVPLLLFFLMFFVHYSIILSFSPSLSFSLKDIFLYLF